MNSFYKKPKISLFEHMKKRMILFNCGRKVNIDFIMHNYFQ